MQTNTHMHTQHAEISKKEAGISHFHQSKAKRGPGKENSTTVLLHRPLNTWMNEPGGAACDRGLLTLAYTPSRTVIDMASPDSSKLIFSFLSSSIAATPPPPSQLLPPAGKFRPTASLSPPDTTTASPREHSPLSPLVDKQGTSTALCLACPSREALFPSLVGDAATTDDREERPEDIPTSVASSPPATAAAPAAFSIVAVVVVVVAACPPAAVSFSPSVSIAVVGLRGRTVTTSNDSSSGARSCRTRPGSNQTMQSNRNGRGGGGGCKQRQCVCVCGELRLGNGNRQSVLYYDVDIVGKIESTMEWCRAFGYNKRDQLRHRFALSLRDRQHSVLWQKME